MALAIHKLATIPERPTRRGYGGELIICALSYHLLAETALDFTPDGVRCWVFLPADPFGTPAGEKTT